MVNIKIEGVSYQVEEGLTILEAAKKCGYEIPSLCAFNHGECNHGSCRVCLVEVVGARGLVASCVYPVNEGMEIIISSPKATEARRASVELLLSNHNINCQQCDKNGKCELLHVAGITGAREGRYQGSKTATTLDELSPAIIRDTSKCILCGRCVARCKNAHGEDMGILGFENRGFNTIVAPAENRSFLNSPCIQCGQCVSVCPTGALMEKSEIARVDAAFKAGKHVVVQTAPAVRAALGEEFGMSVGDISYDFIFGIGKAGNSISSRDGIVGRADSRATGTKDSTADSGLDVRIECLFGEEHILEGFIVLVGQPLTKSATDLRQSFFNTFTASRQAKIENGLEELVFNSSADQSPHSVIESLTAELDATEKFFRQDLSRSRERTAKVCFSGSRTFLECVFRFTAVAGNSRSEPTGNTNGMQTNLESKLTSGLCKRVGFLANQRVLLIAGLSNDIKSILKTFCFGQS